MKKKGFLFLFLLMVSLINLQAKPVKVSFQTQDGWSISAAYQAPDKQSKTVVLLHDVAKSHREFEVFCGKVSEKDWDIWRWICADMERAYPKGPILPLPRKVLIMTITKWFVM